MKIKFLLPAMMILLLASGIVHAVGLAMNPGSLRYTNVLRGGYAERTFRVSTSNTDPIRVKLEMDPTTPEINSWLTIEPNMTYFNISAGNFQEFKVILQPPDDVPNGNYETRIRFVVMPDVKPSGRTVSIIQAGITSKVEITINDFEVKACRVIRSSISDAEKGDPIKSSYQIYNNGNVVNTPEFIFDIWDDTQSEIVKSLSFSPYDILPTTRDTYSINISTDELDAKQYFAEMRVPACGDYREIETFDVLEEGEISSSGTLRQIRNEAWHESGDIVEIMPSFVNTGENDVDAQFKGYVFKDEKIIDVLESDILKVPSGESMNFEFYYPVEETGRYMVKGRVFYEKKRTFEVESRFNVNPRTESDPITGEVTASSSEEEGNSNNLVYLGLVFGIIAVLLMIIRKKRSVMRRRHH